MTDTAYFLAIFLIFLRITTFFLVANGFFPNGTPAIMKGVIGMILSFGVITSMDYDTIISGITSNYMVIFYMICEVGIGAAFGYVVNLIFEVFRMAGSYMDMQSGFSMMNVVDPVSNASNTLLANLTYTVSMLIFFIVNGHHELIKCLVQSFNLLPIGNGISFGNSFETFLNTFIEFFEIGVRAALPLLIILLIVELCLALISRTVPQINVMILGAPVKIVVGLLVFVSVIPIIIKLLIYAFDQMPNALDQILRSIGLAPVLFIFANDDKTEEPTDKKLSDARKKGQVPRSKEIGLAAGLVACVLVLIAVTGLIGNTIKDFFIYYFQDGLLQEVNQTSLSGIIIQLVIKILLCILLVAVPIMIAGIAGSLAQVGFLVTTEPLKPSLGKLNPINGFKNMFSVKSLVQLVKNLAVVVLIAFLGYQFLIGNYQEVLQIYSVYFPELGPSVINLVIEIFAEIALVMGIIAIIDYVLQKKMFMMDMRMTKQEIKDEYKQMEGDPKIKGKIRQKQREMSQRRMMESVADATVVVTNPTHYAVALKYEDGQMEAPKVVAKGADLIALKIKEVALQNNVPIMENKPLARMLYDKVEIEEEVPQEMYQAVAEILAMVYNLNKTK